jgi:hypothetical protein
MQPQLFAFPRYTLANETLWLVGIDPVRRYWVKVNGNPALTIAIPGLVVSSGEALRPLFLAFRTLRIGDTIALPTFTRTALKIHCLADNLYAIAYPIDNAPTWHLFDRETIETFLLSAHPDWHCAPQDLELGRDLILRSWQLPSAA